MRSTLVTLLLLLPIGAQAETYCQVSTGQYGTGDKSVSITMKVVIDTVRRPEIIPGQESSPWCALSFFGRTFYKPIEGVQKPKLGKAQLAHYRARYRASKPGSDSFVLKVHQMGPTNDTTELTATVNVEVVSEPF
jgi:hypothetical protein